MQEKTTYNKNESSFARLAKNFVAGGAAGAVTGCVVAPAEKLKVVLQTSDSTITNLLTSRQFLLQALKSPSYFMPPFALVCALEFSVFEQFKHKIKAHSGSEVTAECGGVMMSGAMGGVASALGDHLLFMRKSGLSVVPTVRKFAAQNPAALFRGTVPMVYREIGFAGGLFKFGPMLGAWFAHRLAGEGKDVESVTAMNTIGVFSALLLSTAVSHPLDGIKARMQEKQKEQGVRARVGFIETLCESVKSPRQFVGLYRGLTPRLMLAPAGGTLLGACYSSIRPMLGA